MYNNNYQDIIDAQNGNKEKMTSLVENNMGLVYNIVRRFQGRGYEIEDLKQIGILAIAIVLAGASFVMMRQQSGNNAQQQVAAPPPKPEAKSPTPPAPPSLPPAPPIKPEPKKN